MPSSTFIFDAYNTTLQTAAAGNMNPLRGQPAFSGTDGGEVTGSWGLSQVNLAAMGVNPGDTIQLRFDMGMDGCTGLDGWYVDDVKVQACNTKKELAAKP